MAPINAHLVPWMNYAEWHFVYRLLFPPAAPLPSIPESSPSTTMTTTSTMISDMSNTSTLNTSDASTSTSTMISQVRGIQRVKAWMARGKIPIAIDATIALLEAYHFDLRDDGSSQMKQMMYAMAIIRFVNGFVDQHQRSLYARSIMVIAKEIGLPLSFVEIRHAATHDKLPSLNNLRRATTDGLEWLHERYWAVKSHFVVDRKESVTALVVKYRDVRKRELREMVLKKMTVSEEIIGSSTKDAIENVLSACPTHALSETLIPALLEPGVLVPKNVLKQIDVSASVDVPREYVLIWRPLLEACVRKWRHFYAFCFNHFLNRLYSDDRYLLSLSTQTVSTPTQNDKTEIQPVVEEKYLPTIASWTHFFLRHLIQHTQNDQDLVRLVCENCFELVLRKPNRFSPLLLDPILRFLPLKLTQNTKLMDVCGVLVSYGQRLMRPYEEREKLKDHDDDANDDVYETRLTQTYETFFPTQPQSQSPSQASSVEVVDTGEKTGEKRRKIRLCVEEEWRRGYPIGMVSPFTMKRKRLRYAREQVFGVVPELRLE